MNRMLPLNRRSVRSAPIAFGPAEAGRHLCRARSARTAGILAACSATLALLPSFAFHAQGPGFPGPGPGGRGGGFGGVQPDRQVVAQFDKNGDERLDTTERKAAREWLSTQPVFGPGGRGGRFGDPSAPPTAGRKLSPADVTAHPGSPVYDPATLRTVFLKFEADDWEQELAAFNNTDVDVPAALTVDGKTYKDPVGVHFRGASSYFMVPEGRKRSLNVSIDFVDGKQDLGGYKTLNLLNANGDPTFLRAVLYTHIASHYIATPKMNFVRVAINGESWGIYLNAQQFNKDFTRDFFNSTKGVRWKVPGSPGGRAGLEYIGERVEDYKRLYEIASKDDPRSWADLIKLTRILQETPPDKLEAALAPILDVDGALKFLAVDVALVNSDGYWTRASDYNMYQDEQGRFHILPHDVNEGLGSQEGGGRRGGFPGMRAGGPAPSERMRGRVEGFGRGGGPELDPLVGLDDASKALRVKLLAVPALRARYIGYVRDIAERWLDWKTLGPIAEQHRALIAADVKADTRKLYSSEAFDTGLDGLKTFVEARRAYLLKATERQ
jgi:spore coat protein CotH